jgi:hypothetical protein
VVRGALGETVGQRIAGESGAQGVSHGVEEVGEVRIYALDIRNIGISSDTTDGVGTDLWSTIGYFETPVPRHCLKL